MSLISYKLLEIFTSLLVIRYILWFTKYTTNFEIKVLDPIIAFESETF